MVCCPLAFTASTKRSRSISGSTHEIVMTKKKGPKTPPNLAIWIEARKRHRLSDVQVQMARELGLNPKKLGGMDNHEQERWKEPLPQDIETLYRKRFHKSMPDNVVSIEQRAAEILAKKEQRKKTKLAPPSPVEDIQIDESESSRSRETSG